MDEETGQGQMTKRSLGIRGKLVTIFVLIKVLPLLALAWFSWSLISSLGWTVREKTEQLVFETQGTVSTVGSTATSSSIRALDLKSREAIERLSTDTARRVADFLYARDADIRQAALVPVNAEAYRRFLAPLSRSVIVQPEWILNGDGTAWEPAVNATGGLYVPTKNIANSKDFHSRPPEGLRREQRPLFLEMTFVDMRGREVVKVTTSERLASTLRDIRNPANTYCRAERYYPELRKLKPGGIYVSDVIGAYVPSPVVGMYTPARAKALDIPFAPEQAGYAGKENPVGRRFEGIVRWATPVLQEGKQIGWVTLALDHTHIMEFTDHILPTEERYTDISDASSGNYAFMWDYEGRNISHPRDYFIAGYDPQTGAPATPWLEESIYEAWQASGLPSAEFLPGIPTFEHQSLSKKPSGELMRAGFVGLDCRYLNFAPQCDGWHNLTQYGGSGSFVIFWSGLWKLTTASAIPYHTGQYGRTPRGFGYVTIGANVDEFHQAATQTANKIETLVAEFTEYLGAQNDDTQSLLRDSMARSMRDITLSTLIMVIVVICIAIWMATVLRRKITTITEGVRRFHAGELEARLPVDSGDELGELCQVINDASASFSALVSDLKIAEERMRGIFENAVEGIYQSTPDGRYLNVNPALVRMMGYKDPEQLLGGITDIAAQVYADENDRAELLRRLERDGIVNNFEFRARRRDGKQMWLSTNVRAVRGGDGEIAYIEGMVGDVTSHKQMKEAEQGREAAVARDQAKSLFLANMSHEIRTPMNAIIGVTDLLQEGGLDENQRALVTLLRSSGEHLLEIINDILDVSQIEAGKIRLAREPFDLHSAIEDCVGLLSVRATMKGLAIRHRIGATVPRFVVGDVQRFRQVLLNLVGNAVKFTDDGYVVVRLGVLERTGRSVMLSCSVQDSGEGIAPEKLGQVFDSFVQADSSSTRRHGGTGLGLAICRTLVTLMGGDIQAKSELGKGSTFTFSVQLEVAERGALPKQERRKEPDASSSASPVDTEGILAGRRVLYVDDSESNRVLVSLYLKRTGALLDLAENGFEGLGMLEQHAYDIVLLDMELPEMNGYTIAGRIRELPAHAQVPILALTANAMADDRQRCLDAGCSEYMPKPIRKDALIATMQALLGA